MLVFPQSLAGFPPESLANLNSKLLLVSKSEMLRQLLGLCMASNGQMTFFPVGLNFIFLFVPIFRSHLPGHCLTTRLIKDNKIIKRIPTISTTHYYFQLHIERFPTILTKIIYSVYP